MHFLHIRRFPETLRVGCPENPILDVRIESRHISLQRPTYLLHSELHTCIIRKTFLWLQVRIATRLEIEVVHRGITVIACHRSLQHHIPRLPKNDISEEGWNGRHPIVLIDLLTHNCRQREDFPRAPTSLHIGMIFWSPLVEVLTDMEWASVVAVHMRIIHIQSSHQHQLRRQHPIGMGSKKSRIGVTT